MICQLPFVSTADNCVYRQLVVLEVTYDENTSNKLTDWRSRYLILRYRVFHDRMILAHLIKEFSAAMEPINSYRCQKISPWDCILRQFVWFIHSQPIITRLMFRLYSHASQMAFSYSNFNTKFCMHFPFSPNLLGHNVGCNQRKITRWKAHSL